MAKSAKEREQKIELEPDAWQRFERAVGTVVKSKPQHRQSKKKGAKVAKRKKPKG